MKFIEGLFVGLGVALVVFGVSVGINSYLNGHSAPVKTAVDEGPSTVVLESMPVPTSNGPTCEVSRPTTKVIKKIKLDTARTIYISGEITNNIDSAIGSLKEMDKASNSPIYVLLDSPGGSVVDGAAFISAIESSRAPVYTVCVKVCASMAAMIHQYGTKRYMVDRAVLMFHRASWGVEGTIDQMQTRSDWFNRYTSKIEAHVAKRSGVSLEAYINQAKGEIWIDAEDATNKHLNDSIVSIDSNGTSDARLLFQADPDQFFRKIKKDDNDSDENIKKLQW